MPRELYLNKTFFDTQRNKYRPISEIDSGANWVEMKTEDDKLLVMFNNLEEPKHQQRRLDWLVSIRDKSALDSVLVFPIGILTGLKRNEVGYVSAPEIDGTLNNYLHPPKGEKLFKWYFDKTGGITYRLKIAYSIVNAIQRVHSKGYCLVDLSPNHTHLQPYNTEKEQLPIIQFSGIDKICSYTYSPISSGADRYCDPLVYLKRTSASSSSDAYSFAVMVFEMLTACHPFIGDDTERMGNEELSAAINSGTLDYIGNTNSNYNEDFEYTRILLPEDLSELFRQMFVDGRFNASARPTLENFKAAIIRSLRKVIKCDHKGCEREYPFNTDNVCPFCESHTKRVLTARVHRVIATSEKLLLPYDGIKGFSALPPIVEETNFIVIHEGTNKMTRSCFESDASVEKANTGILIHYSQEKKQVGIRNRFKKLSIFVNGKELTPYSKADKGQHSDIWLPDSKKIVIELPDNAQIEPEGIVKMDTDEYGSITHKWTVTIK